jgi:hypothetical protein
VIPRARRDYPHIIRPGLSEPEKRAHVRAISLLRRHLTQSQKRDLIADQLRETPEQSDRQIADTLRVSPTTVGTVRDKLQAGVQIGHLDHRVGKDGKRYPSVFARNEKDAQQGLWAVQRADPEDLAREDESGVITTREA